MLWWIIGHDSSWRVWCIFHDHKIHYFGFNLFSFLPIVSRSFAPSFSLSSFVAISLDWCLSLYRFDAFKCFLTSLRPFKGYQVIYSSRSLSLWKGNSFVNCINPPCPITLKLYTQVVVCQGPIPKNFTGLWLQTNLTLVIHF